MNVVDVVRQNNARILSLLVAVPGAVCQDDLEQSLIIAVKLGLVVCIQILLNANISPDLLDSSGNCLLKIAAETGKAEVVSTLVQGKCSLNSVNCQGRTALHSASSLGFVECGYELIRAGADINLKDSAGNTPLILAAKNCHKSFKVLKALVDAKCNLNEQNAGEERTALHYTSLKAIGSELLLSAGADPNIQDSDGNTPLILAANEGFDTIVICLSMYHCDPDLVNCYGKTAMHYLSMKGHYEGMEALIQIGASVSSSDADGMMPISYACKYNRLQAVKCLLRANCCVEATSEAPLELALRARHFVVAKLLILAGSRLDALQQWVGDVQSAKAEHVQHQALLFEEQQQPFERCDEEIAVDWFQDWLHSPHSLRQICRIWLRQHLGTGLRRREDELPLPQSMKDYLTLKEVEDHHLE